ncbi:transposase [Mycobacterium intracellulare subsp. chimaera]|uniref:Transposase n=1 Tax=Mycobacterium intracellulare subsp. chimaera TaxID=222805 RepID=A0A220XTD5_MYCIT|nr:transposase [Mycobacterium intracellulare subsp. chimaera]ASL20803.1 transposase [Mycobacterium intracellulare subsp. chimaera]ETZ30988.1 helix-turn-helix domain protein [Mycobacterium intracellulare MIN_052511_1280]
MVHHNAPLSETGRLRLARCVVEEGWPLRRAAERFQVSATTASRWAGGYRREGVGGMADRSSRPHQSPNQTPTRTERRIIKVRVLRRWGPHRIAYLWGLHPSTVHRLLTRYRLAKLRWLDGSTGHVVRRMEPAACGDIVHIDVKKLGKIPAGGGWRMLGRTAGNHNSWADKVLAGAASAATRWVVIIFSIPLLMATRAWLTASCLATSARRLPPRSGSGQIPGSPNVA